MPELPEVETIVRGLNELIRGKTIALAVGLNPSSFPNAPDQVQAWLIGSTVQAVSRRGKTIRITFTNGWALLIHLKMTGQLVYRGTETAHLIRETLPGKSTRVILTFRDDSRLYFNDQRKFGWMKLLPVDEIAALSFFQKLGPEPLEKEFTANRLARQLSRHQGSAIKAALLDQTVVAGIGNIYADESLFLAGIDPTRPCRDLTEPEIQKLHRAIRRVLRESITLGGSTRENYRNAVGQKGDYLEQARVYNRAGQPCPSCGRPIAKIRTAGRGTHYCPICQH